MRGLGRVVPWSLELELRPAALGMGSCRICAYMRPISCTAGTARASTRQKPRFANTFSFTRAKWRKDEEKPPPIPRLSSKCNIQRTGVYEVRLFRVAPVENAALPAMLPVPSIASHTPGHAMRLSLKGLSAVRHPPCFPSPLMRVNSPREHTFRRKLFGRSRSPKIQDILARRKFSPFRPSETRVCLQAGGRQWSTLGRRSCICVLLADSHTCDEAVLLRGKCA
ncbi:hypothetical protein OH76DRAFT_787790 [Lentinus brumalis]|uniref:Uncharacterized protein n=1 Tax=Lentinus brumalis TaxID=2498619 RepID=A0A371D436_9APHY|nr:hypothetical protein OH76DRAFT_787790 [Polyporus brumalis]